MISQARFHGGSRLISSGSTINLLRGLGALNLITTTAGGVQVRAEDARHFLKTGGVIYWIRNRGSNAFTFADSAGTAIVTVSPGQMCKAWVTSNTTAAGAWKAKVKTPFT